METNAVSQFSRGRTHHEWRAWNRPLLQERIRDSHTSGHFKRMQVFFLLPPLGASVLKPNLQQAWHVSARIVTWYKQCVKIDAHDEPATSVKLKSVINTQTYCDRHVDRLWQTREQIYGHTVTVTWTDIQTDCGIYIDTWWLFQTHGYKEIETDCGRHINAESENQPTKPLIALNIIIYVTRINLSG